MLTGELTSEMVGVVLVAAYLGFSGNLQIIFYESAKDAVLKLVVLPFVTIAMAALLVLYS